ncbi:MAG: 16S rRNA (uracil(1498)-N(3))-methyltransferase [Chthoniobacterales bacterium]|nr:16S rRNA (uracil(1498)-N(3))-methyltransferase [Chthoniobacterales bacterium]
MHRFYLSPNEWSSATLSGAEAHHARNVLRLAPGARLTVFDGHGREAIAEVTALGAGAVQLRLVQVTETPPLRCRLTLAQAIPKRKNMDLIVQKAVEIGAAEIFPLLSTRTVIQLDPESAAQKQAKWQTVALEAAKQCGQNWLPQVHLPQTADEFFKLPSAGFDLRLIGSLQPGARHLKQVLAEQARQPASVLMMIGPEGDFTPAEIALARSHGCVPLTLGPIILRVETAAIYCLSILSYELL